MPIVAWPEDVQIPGTIVCAICGADKLASEVTAGLCDAAAQQAFACDDHFRSSGQYIVGWIDFANSQNLYPSDLAELEQHA